MRDRSGSRGNDSYSDQVRNRNGATGGSGGYSGSNNRRNRDAGGGSGYGTRSGSGYGPRNGSGYGPENGGGYGPRNGSGYGPGNGSGYSPGNGGGYGSGYQTSYEDEVKENNGLLNFLHFDDGNMSVIKNIGLIILGVLVIMLVVKLGMIIVTGFDPFVASAKSVLDAIFSRLIEAVVAGGILGLFITMFLGKYLPVGIRSKLPLILILLILVYSFIPALGSALGELVFILIGIAILLNVFRF